MRSVIFACQKSVNLFRQLGLEQGEKDLDFAKTIFRGILKFTFKYKKGELPRWDENQSFSTRLGDSGYPLFRFCYDYIVWQHYEEHWVKEARADLKQLRLYDSKKSLGDQDLQTLYAYCICTEEEIRTAVENIIKKLEEPGAIAFQEYGKIAYYLIVVHHLLNCDISQAKDMLEDDQVRRHISACKKTDTVRLSMCCSRTVLPWR